MTKHEVWSLANHGVAAWNAYDLDLIMTHYDDAIELISPVAAHLLGTPDGKVAGKPNLRAYFQRGLEANSSTLAQPSSSDGSIPGKIESRCLELHHIDIHQCM